MAHIYSKSYLTIAAHAPSSCKVKFLGEQEFGRSTCSGSLLPNIEIRITGERSKRCIRDKEKRRLSSSAAPPRWSSTRRPPKRVFFLSAYCISQAWKWFGNATIAISVSAVTGL